VKQGICNLCLREEYMKTLNRRSPLPGVLEQFIEFVGLAHSFRKRNVST